MKKEQGVIEKMKSERFQIALDEFAASLEKMQRVVGHENFTFVAAMTIFDDFLGDMETPQNAKVEPKFDNDGYTWQIGDTDNNVVNAECLLDACKERLKEENEEWEKKKADLYFTKKEDE